MTQAGPAIPMIAVTDRSADAGPALRVAVVSDGRSTEAGPARPVIVVSDGRPTQGNEPVPVVLATGVQSSHILAGPAMPVVVVGGGNLDPTMVYTSLIESVFGASLIEHWAGAEPSGSVALAEVDPARNGTYTAVTLNQPGIGDGRASGLYVPASSSRNNIYSSSFNSAFNTGNAGTAIQWIQTSAWTDGADRYASYIQGPTGANRVYFRKPSVNNTIVGNYSAGGVDENFAYVISDTAFFPVGLTWELSPSNAAYFYVKGQRVGFLGTLGTWVGPITSTVCVIGALTGSSGANPWDGKIAHTAYGSTALNSADIALLHRNPGHVLCEGDSRTSWQVISWPQQMQPLQPLGWWPVATGGATLVDMQARAAANIAAYKRTGLSKNAICILGGLNDMLAGADLATIQSRLSALCLTYRNAGFSVVVNTELDAQSAAANAAGWHLTMRPALNAWILANYASFATRVADSGGQAQLSDATNGTYFAGDFVHPIAAGYAVLASTNAAQVNTL